MTDIDICDDEEDDHSDHPEERQGCKNEEKGIIAECAENVFHDDDFLMMMEKEREDMILPLWMRDYFCIPLMICNERDKRCDLDSLRDCERESMERSFLR